jgi:hypothetical protein
MKEPKSVPKGGKGPASIAVTRSARVYPKGAPPAPAPDDTGGAPGAIPGMKKGGKVPPKGKKR